MESCRASRLSGAAITMLAILLACPQQELGQPCDGTADCRADEICIASTCRQACNSNLDCTSELTCWEGACLPRVPSTDASSGPHDALTDLGGEDASAADRSRPDAGPVELVALDSTQPEAAIPDIGVDAASADLPGLDVEIEDLTALELPAADQAVADAHVEPWLDNGYTCRVRLQVENDSLASELTDFTVLVPVELQSSSCLFSPEVVIFYDAVGEILGHEREESAPAQPALFWVRLPSIAPAGTPTYFWLYFSSALPSTVAAGPAWGPAFRGVWHLDQDLEVDLEARDSTGNTNHAAPMGGMDADNRVIGQVGYAQSFNGTDEHLLIGDPEDGSLDFDGSESFTYSLWINTDETAGNWDMPWSKGGSTPSQAGYDFELGRGTWSAWLSDGVEGMNIDMMSAASLASSWHHLAAVVNRAAMEVSVYVDGATVARDTLPVDYDLTTDLAASIGANPSGGFSYTGSVDEVRVEATARSDARIAAEYRSMTGQMISLGAIEQQP